MLLKKEQCSLQTEILEPKELLVWKVDVLGNLGEKSPFPHTIGPRFQTKILFEH